MPIIKWGFAAVAALSTAVTGVAGGQSTFEPGTTPMTIMRTSPDSAPARQNPGCPLSPTQLRAVRAIGIVARVLDDAAGDAQADALAPRQRERDPRPVRQRGGRPPDDLPGYERRSPLPEANGPNIG